MKNNFKFLFFSAFLLMLGVTSCSKDDDSPKEEPKEEPVVETPVFTQPELSLSASEVTVDDEQPEATAITFSWTAADIDFEINTTYTVYMNVEGEDVFEGYSQGVNNELEYSLTNAQLASLLTDDFGVAAGETANLEVVVHAQDTEGEVESSVSESETFTATLPETGPEALYLIGGAYDDSWDISNAAELTMVEDGVYEAENVTLQFGTPEDGKGLKLLVSNEEWFPFYSQNLESDTFGDLSLFTEEDPDSQLYPLEHGYESAIYTVTANLNTMQFSLTKTGDLEQEVDYSTAVFMLGDATPFGWEFNQANAMTETSEGVYEYSEVQLSAGEHEGFKFFVGIDSWDDYYGRVDPENLDPYWTVKLRGESEADAQYYLNQAGMEAGTYKVVLDTNEMTVDVTPVE